MIRAIRPSWFVLFWAVTYLTIFFPYVHQPVQRILSGTTTILIAAVFVMLSLIIRLNEEQGVGAAGTGDYVEHVSTVPWHFPQWLRVVGITSVLISAGLLLLVCTIVIRSGAGTIYGWQAAMESAFPEFGRVFLHLKQIAIPYVILKSSRLRIGTLSLLAFYFFGSVIYSFTMGERVFFLETSLLIFIAAILRGWLRITPAKIAVVGFSFLAFFMIVENAKRFILTDTQEGNFLENFSLFSSSLIERFFAYYGDPAAKLQYVLSEARYFSDFVWFKNSVGMYASRFGMDIEFPAGVNIPYWASGYGGPVLTNPGGFTSLLTDFGPLFFVPLSLFLGLFTWAYRHVLMRSSPAACVYLICVLAALELPRVAYFYWARFWMPILFMLLSLAFFKLLSKSGLLKGHVCAESRVT